MMENAFQRCEPKCIKLYVIFTLILYLSLCIYLGFMLLGEFKNEEPKNTLSYMIPLIIDHGVSEKRVADVKQVNRKARTINLKETSGSDRVYVNQVDKSAKTNHPKKTSVSDHVNVAVNENARIINLKKTSVSGHVNVAVDENARKINLKATSANDHVYVNQVDKSAKTNHPKKTSASDHINIAVDENTRTINLKATSASDHVNVAVDEATIFTVRKTSHKDRGMHVVVINQYNAKLMAHNQFDTYQPSASASLLHYLDNLQNGRIVVLAVLDEASYNLEKQGRRVLQSYGSRHIEKLGWRSTWVFVFKKAHGRLAEDFHYGLGSSHTAESNIEIKGLVLEKDKQECVWSEKRKEFCSEHEGYGAFCDCLQPLMFDTDSPPIPNSRIDDIPIAVIASNRPLYLYRMLTGLLKTPGVKRRNINVFIDGPFQEPIDVVNVLGLHYKQNPRECDKTCGIQQNYKNSLTYIFDKYKVSNHVIIFEDDISVSPDIMDYFSQLLPVLDEDKTLYCVSAWNDQGYVHSSNDPAMLYRIETMPGLGWILKRDIYKNELEPNWPKVGQHVDWDMWIRKNMLKNRECIIPDVSRTYHFGKNGVNMNPYFHEVAFKGHALNNKTGLIFDANKMKEENYAAELHKLISAAQVVDHTKSPCKDKDFIPDTVGKSYVFYIRYDYDNDFETLVSVCKCFKMWFIEARGYHKRMVRFWYKKNMIFAVGSTSPFVKYKPSNVEPLYIQMKKE